MPIGDSMSGTPIPAVGTAGTTYASQLVAFLTEVKSRLEAKVAMASLLPALFDMTNNAIANLKYAGLYEQSSAPTTPVGSLQRYQNNLYYVGNSGAVRITNGTQLDATGIGGIGGDYTAPAGLNYDLAALEYFAYSDTTANPKKWARVGAQEFDVYGQLQSTVRVRIDWAGGTNYTLMLPAAVPSETTQLRMDTSGNVTVGRQTKTKMVNIVSALPFFSGALGGWTFNQIVSATTAGYWIGPTTSAFSKPLYLPIVLDEGDILTGVTVYYQKNSDSTSTLAFAVHRLGTTGGAPVTVCSAGESGNATGNGNKALTGGTLPETFGSNNSYVLEVIDSADDSPSAANRLYAVKLTYTSAL